ncbi:MAG: hypothetical protein A2902_01065 [Elusimicrobia bacterium RIFCSPLOWO2_01_FULL_64_13]|nr:MAG: hypothetical protein A2636_03655 [Elusimicrobia bacterium RIFCSPHIGHO2_01_FULL_64_10]OGR97886.1 MAG: hypothetical protein A2902_01065 [Elusimicrobia bacterium RIFCSPLOWO2_01_FULL_64_13]
MSDGPPALAYRYRDSLYLNITSRCPTACEFCIKFSWNYRYRGVDLRLGRDPAVADILREAGDPSAWAEVVYCGYGESTYRLEDMKEISRSLRARGAGRIRLNTIGLGNLIHGRNIAPDLRGTVDSVSVSLNTKDPVLWAKIHRPLPEFREKGFESVLDFIRQCAKAVPDTVVTTVEGMEPDLEGFKALVAGLGASIRVRPHLDDYENS